jgi:hypothetical protein
MPIAPRTPKIDKETIKTDRFYFKLNLFLTKERIRSADLKAFSVSW